METIYEMRLGLAGGDPEVLAAKDAEYAAEEQRLIGVLGLETETLEKLDKSELIRQYQDRAVDDHQEKGYYTTDLLMLKRAGKAFEARYRAGLDLLCAMHELVKWADDAPEVGESLDGKSLVKLAPIGDRLLAKLKDVVETHSPRLTDAEPGEIELMAEYDEYQDLTD